MLYLFMLCIECLHAKKLLEFMNLSVYAVLVFSAVFRRWDEFNNHVVLYN